MALIALLIALMSLCLPVLSFSNPLPTGWTRAARAEPHERLRLRVVLASPNFPAFEQYAIDIATPDHHSYGKHLTREDLHHLIKPSNQTLASVLGWLQSANIHDVEVSGPHLILNTSVAKVESLLDAEFHHYVGEDGQHVIRTLRYTIPSRLSESIDMIQPTTRFPQLRPLRSFVLPQQSPYPPASQHSVDVSHAVDLDWAACNSSVTPICLRRLYGLDQYSLPNNSSYSIGIAGFLNQYARHSDWHLFADKYAPWANSTTFTAVGSNPQEDLHTNVEASLDIQYAMALAPHVPMVFYSTPGQGPLVPDADQPNTELNENEPFLEHLQALVELDDRDLPSVFSYSYGENEQSVPRDYAIHVCKMFAQLGVRGVSILISSGDDGPGSSCAANDGSYETKYLPTFPASCSWVTAVGGTHEVFPERAAPFSGGGFSDLFYALDYQKAAVAAFLNKTGPEHRGHFQPHGRAFPDVAAQASHFWVISQGVELTVSGTR